MAQLPLRVGFNARPFCQKGIRGLGRHTLELILALKKQHPEIQIYLYCYDEIHSVYKKELAFAHFRDKRIRPKILWDAFYLERELRADRIDVFHSTNNLGIPFFTSIPCFVTIHDSFTHDARFPWGSGLANWWGSLNYRLELSAIRKSRGFFTVSSAAREDIASKMNLPLQKIMVTYNGCKFEPRPSGGGKDRYFLYVGGFEARKNLRVLLEAVVEFNQERSQKIPLKLVGNPGSASADLKQFIEAHADLFEVVAAIDDASLVELYARASCFIFPSLQEGFGLPLIEAMRVGCPVIASDIKVFREIAGESALYFSPLSASDLKRRMDFLEQNTNQSKVLAQAGLERSLIFTWENMAEVTYSEYVKAKD